MTDGLASQNIFERLLGEAQASSRPEVRTGSLNRLKQACDALVNGTAHEVFRKAFKTDGGLRHNPQLNPSNIDKYVRARKALGDPYWTGPTRVFISADADLRSYLNAREDERVKPKDVRKRPSERQKDIEDAVNQIKSVEMRQMVRHDIEEGRLAKKRLDILTRGLRTLPGIDVDSLLRSGSARQYPETSLQVAQNMVPGTRPPVTGHDAKVLKTLLDRLGDEDEMARAGLESDGKRVRMNVPPRTTIIRIDEMDVLRRLASIQS